MHKYFILFLIFLFISCATTLELYTYQVTANSKVLDKSISSLNWIDNDKVKVIKVRRKGKDILKLTNSFKFSEKDTVYIIGKSSDKNYIKLFFD